MYDDRGGGGGGDLAFGGVGGDMWRLGGDLYGDRS